MATNWNTCTNFGEKRAQPNTCIHMFIQTVFVLFSIFQAGKLKHRPKHETSHDSNGGIGSNLKSIVVVAILMLLMMFAVHCTWVTSNAYSSPSIVLAFYNGNDGLVIMMQYAFLCREDRTPHNLFIVSRFN